MPQIQAFGLDHCVCYVHMYVCMYVCTLCLKNNDNGVAHYNFNAH